MSATMREIAVAVNKPESTVYRWRRDNPALYTAAKDYAEKLNRIKLDKSGIREDNVS